MERLIELLSDIKLNFHAIEFSSARKKEREARMDRIHDLISLAVAMAHAEHHMREYSKSLDDVCAFQKVLDSK